MTATNQYALPLLTYCTWTQTWPLSDLQQLGREARKIILANGGNHPQGATAFQYTCIYMSRKSGGRGLRVVEQEYKNIKVKAAMKLYQNPDQSMPAVRMFEEKSMRTGRQAMIKDARKCAEELGVQLQLVYPKPKCITEDGEEVEGKKVKGYLSSARQKEARETVKGERSQGKMIRERWEDENLNQKACLLLQAPPLEDGTNSCRCWLTRIVPAATTDKSILSQEDWDSFERR